MASLDAPPPAQRSSPSAPRPRRTAQRPRSTAGASSRHLLKAISWRIVGTIDTFLLSMLLLTFLGPLLGLEPAPGGVARTAGLIAATEILTKIALFWMHEWGWARLHWGARSGPRDRRWRSFAKAFSWRLFASLDTTILALIFTGSLRMAISIGGAEVITKIFLYYLHERAWERVAIGKPSVALPPDPA
jgi:uncharacterized membrane protein